MIRVSRFLHEEVVVLLLEIVVSIILKFTAMSTITLGGILSLTSFLPGIYGEG